MAKDKRLGYLDLLRFIAISGVIAAHTSLASHRESVLGFQDFTLGRFGVQLFFLVSGTTVWISLKSCQRHFSKSWLAFFTKRIFRIVPLFFFFSLSVYAFRGFIDTERYFNPLAGLFPDSINIVPGGWSIWNEIYFYFSLPIYALIRRNRILVVILGALLATATHYIAISHTGNSALIQTQESDFDYLNVFSQFIFFQIGIEIAAKNKANLIYFFCAFTGASLTFKAFFFRDFLLTPDFGSGYINAGIALILTGAYLMVAKAYDGLCRWNKSVIAYLEGIGRSTYTMYVIHFGVISVIPLLTGQLVDQIPLELEVAFVLVCTYYLSILIQPITESVWVSVGNKCLQRVP